MSKKVKKIFESKLDSHTSIYVCMVGSGKNTKVYFLDHDFYYDKNDNEIPIKVGDNVKCPDDYFNEWFLTMTLGNFKKISKEILKRKN